MSESNQSGGKQNSAVGYRRPPVNRQFRPGQSGNPKGRPKGSKNLATTFAEILSRPIKVRDRNGKIRTLSKLEAMIEGITNKAIAGDAPGWAHEDRSLVRCSASSAARNPRALASRRLSKLLALEVTRAGRARPQIERDLRTLIRRISMERGAPRIHGELLKLGFAVAQSTVAKYMSRADGNPSGQCWGLVFELNGEIQMRA
jgi:hypothetical protein